MCGVHSDLIDDPKQGFTVRRIVDIKRDHERAMDVHRRAAITASSPPERPPDALPRAVGFVARDAPSWARRATEALTRAHPESLSWLRTELGESPTPDRITALIDRWPPEVEEGPEELAIAVIRYAEAAGLWHDAALGWERLSQRFETVRRADTLVRAAINAGVVGDTRSRERLLRDAETLDPDAPRARLERLDDDAPPEEQLAVLAELDSDDPALASLILCQRARAEILLEQLDEAARHLDEARTSDPQSMAARILDINLRVQRGRVALRDDRDFSLAEVMAAMRDAGALRRELAEMKRWAESVRVLMLAAEVPLLLRDPAWARAVLQEAADEEVGAPDGAEVLGDAALRAGDANLALRFTDGAESTDGVRRIRATAFVDLPAVGRREAGLIELEELAVSDSQEAVLAAFARLSACLPPTRADWHERSAHVLANSPHRNVARSLRVLADAAKDRMMTALRGAAELPDEVWAAEVRLRVAALRGQAQGVRAAAGSFLRFRPDASGRLLAGLALKDIGDGALAESVLAGVAHDLNAAPRVRADAFHGLLGVLAMEARWPEAERDWRVWRELSTKDLHTPDGRVESWHARLLVRGLGRS